jgi:ADP-heptose:LPS heptosyltransferase
MTIHNDLPERLLGALTRFVSFQINSPYLTRRFFPMADVGEDPIDLSRVGSVLVVRPDEIGDVILTSPFLRELRKHLPSAGISLVVKPGVRNLVEHCPYVNEILTFDWSSSRYWWPAQNHFRARRFVKQELATRRFDLAIVPRWDTDWYHAAFVAYFSKSRYRLGYAENVDALKQKFNRGYDTLFTHVISDTRPRHEVERSLDMLTYLGCSVDSDRLEVWTTPEDEAYAEMVLRDNDVRTDHVLICFGAGARYPRKMWPVEHFAQLGASIRDAFPCRILITGDRSDIEIGATLHRHLGETVIDLTGRTTLRQSAALLGRCNLYVGNDSGPKHMAAARGIPVVEFSWSSRTETSVVSNTVNRFRPWRTPYQILHPEQPMQPCSGVCRAKESHCIRGITVRSAQEAVLQLIPGNIVV